MFNVGWICVHNYVVQRTLLRVAESITFRELFKKEIASKLASRECLEESLTVSVSPTGKGDSKTVCCEDEISLSVSFGSHYISFIYHRLSQFFAVCVRVCDCVSCLAMFELHWMCFLSAEITVYCSNKNCGIN